MSQVEDVINRTSTSDADHETSVEGGKTGPPQVTLTMNQVEEGAKHQAQRAKRLQYVHSP